MNEFYCCQCGSPGMDAVGHFHNELAGHPFRSHQFVLLVVTLSYLRWIYG